jgi:phosphoribosyl 1,2-cyclic phosphate phosphodiesterase
MNGSRFFQLLGTGAGDANFGAPDAAPIPVKDIRRFACNFLSPDVLIDFNHHTPGALRHYEIDPSSIRHLLIGHGHFDHFQPLEIIRFAASLPHPLAVYGNGMVIDALEFCRDNYFDGETGRFVARRAPYNLEAHRLVVGGQITVGEARITAALGNHFMNKPYCIMEQQALNFLLEAQDKKVFYGLDSSYMIPQTLAMLAGTHLDIAILDATFGPREIDPLVSGHHNWKMLDETIADLRGAGCIDASTIIVADHLSVNSVGTHDEIAAAQQPKGITLAYDGLTLPL